MVDPIAMSSSTISPAEAASEARPERERDAKANILPSAASCGENRRRTLAVLLVALGRMDARQECARGRKQVNHLCFAALG